MSYITAAGSRTSHKAEVSADCHYRMRFAEDTDFRVTERKPKGCSVCDECQRLERNVRKARKSPHGV